MILIASLTSPTPRYVAAHISLTCPRPRLSFYLPSFTYSVCHPCVCLLLSVSCGSSVPPILAARLPLPAWAWWLVTAVMSAWVTLPPDFYCCILPANLSLGTMAPNSVSLSAPECCKTGLVLLIQLQLCHLRSTFLMGCTHFLYIYCNKPFLPFSSQATHLNLTTQTYTESFALYMFWKDWDHIWWMNFHVKKNKGIKIEIAGMFDYIVTSFLTAPNTKQVERWITKQEKGNVSFFRVSFASVLSYVSLYPFCSPSLL